MGNTFWKSSEEIKQEKIKLDELCISLFGVTSDKISITILIIVGYDERGSRNGSVYDPICKNNEGKIIEINTKEEIPIITIKFKDKTRIYSLTKFHEVYKKFDNSFVAYDH